MKVVSALALILLIILAALFRASGLSLVLLFGIVIPYFAVALFFYGIVYRVLRWAKAPVPFHIPAVSGQQKSLPWLKANNLESPHNSAGVIGRLALEVLLFRSLFRDERVELKRNEKLVYGGNRYLWLGSLAFHWSLLIIIIRHTRLFLEPIPSFVLFVQNLDGIFQLAVPAVFITDIIIILSLAYLFLRRLTDMRIRYISLPADYFAVLLLLSVAVSGVLMRYFFRVDVVAVKEWVLGMLSFHPAIPAGVNWLFYIHLFLICTLISYLPFSKLVHFAGVLLSPTRNLANNSRRLRHVNLWNRPVKVHTYQEWEDDFRAPMKKAGLPVEKE